MLTKYALPAGSGNGNHFAVNVTLLVAAYPRPVDPSTNAKKLHKQTQSHFRNGSAHGDENKSHRAKFKANKKGNEHSRVRTLFANHAPLIRPDEL